MFSGEHATHIMGRRYSLRGIPVGALKECQRYIRIKTDKSYGNHEGKRCTFPIDPLFGGVAFFMLMGLIKGRTSCVAMSVFST